MLRYAYVKNHLCKSVFEHNKFCLYRVDDFYMHEQWHFLRLTVKYYMQCVF